MYTYEKGWYSISTCERLNIKTINPNDLINIFDVKENKYLFLEEARYENYIRYQSIIKTWIRIDVYDDEKGLIKKKLPVIKRYYLDYYFNKNLIIFHTGVDKIKGIVGYLNNKFNSKIQILKNVNLKEFLHKLKLSEINHRLVEGKIINFKLSGGTIGNFHFKNLNQNEYPRVIDQTNTYISWIKLKCKGERENFDIKIYSNGTFYQTRSDETIFEILNIFVSVGKEVDLYK